MDSHVVIRALSFPVLLSLSLSLYLAFCSSVEGLPLCGCVKVVKGHGHRESQGYIQCNLACGNHGGYRELEFLRVCLLKKLRAGL